MPIEVIQLVSALKSWSSKHLNSWLLLNTDVGEYKHMYNFMIKSEVVNLFAN